MIQIKEDFKAFMSRFNNKEEEEEIKKPWEYYITSEHWALDIKLNRFLKSGCIIFDVSIPNEGKFGIGLIDTGKDETTDTFLTHKLYEIDETIICSTMAEFKEKFNKCADDNNCMFYCSEPMTLRIGFIALTHRSNIRYMIGIRALCDWN